MDITKHLLTVITKNKKTGEEMTYNNVVDFGHFHGNDGTGYHQYFRILIGLDMHERITFKPEDVDVIIKL